MQQTVLILGANGRAGSHAADAFWNAGWTVRRYQRGTDMIAAAEGAEVIVNALNPPNYHNWAKLIPEITNQVIAAAQASGATVIIPVCWARIRHSTPTHARARSASIWKGLIVMQASKRLSCARAISLIRTAMAI